MIIYDKNTFSANDSQKKIWTLEFHNILCPKIKCKGIMISNFFLPWSWLNLLSLLFKQ